MDDHTHSPRHGRPVAVQATARTSRDAILTDAGAAPPRPVETVRGAGPDERASLAESRDTLAGLLGLMMSHQRQKLHLTQAQLAERAHISVKYLGEIERGKANVSVDILEELARALGWNPWTLFDPSPQPIASNLYDLLVGHLTQQIRALETLRDIVTSLAPEVRHLSLLNASPATREVAQKKMR